MMMEREIRLLDSAESPEPIEPEASDMLLIIRDGMPTLRVPAHEPDEQVPEDFLILIAIATIWLDPGWRAMMRAVLKQAEKDGLVEGIVRGRPG